MDAESWQTKVEELLALQSILQASLLCHVDGSQQTIDDATAEQLLQQGSRGRELSCEATIHCSIPNGGLTVQVPFCQLHLHWGLLVYVSLVAPSLV